MGDKDTLTKDDLMNMMESYRSNVEFYKELMGTQEVVIEEQGKIIDNLLLISKSQEVSSTKMEKIVQTLTDHDKLCVKNIKEATDTLDECNKKIDANKIENIIEHGKLKNHLIGISGGLILIIIALITALGRMWDKIDVIDDVAKFIGI